VLLTDNQTLLPCPIATACHRPQLAPASKPPALVLVHFRDDYGGEHAIPATGWLQHPHGRFRAVRWDATGRFLVARNDSANRSAPGKWTRIDWVPLDMASYTWAFCFSAYDAPTRGIAETTSVAKPAAPRTGCNGHPYSRMQRLP
jgi:hypothetical protein